jgi:hypothetical protein
VRSNYPARAPLSHAPGRALPAQALPRRRCPRRCAAAPRNGARRALLSPGRPPDWEQGASGPADVPVRRAPRAHDASRRRPRALLPPGAAARAASRRVAPACAALRPSPLAGAPAGSSRSAAPLTRAARAAPRSVWAENLPVVGSGLRDVRYIFLTRMRETVRFAAPARALRPASPRRWFGAPLTGSPPPRARTHHARRWRPSRSWWARSSLRCWAALRTPTARAATGARALCAPRRLQARASRVRNAAPPRAAR